MPRQILLIDGDQYLHRACAAVERDTKWDEENHVLVSNAEEAYDVVQGSINKITHHFGHKDYVLALSEGVVFRKAIDPAYKSNRKDARKPLCFYEVKERLKQEHHCVFFDGLEADDVMGILSTKPGPDEKIIIARDKDMHTVPGKLWDGGKFFVIDEAQADYWHLYQTLVGDVSDGYKGCPGIGPKKAEALLKDCGDPLGAGGFRADLAWGFGVVPAFEKAGLTADDALRNARLARILRWSDWDSKKKEPILWTPPTTS
jgi:5'-3' exonuclease